MLGAGLGVVFTHFYDPMNKTSDRSGQLALPSQVTLTNNGSIPLMAIGAILSLDFLLLDGGMVNSDYDLIGQLMLGSIFISGLMIARCLFQNSQAKKSEPSEQLGMSS
jgi:hypothetical protein